MSAKAKLLGEVPLFSACTPRELSRIAAAADQVDVPPGDVVVREGDPGTAFFVIERGQAVARRGREHLATFGPGDFFGEMALLDQGPRTATVTAETPLRLLSIEADAFDRLLDEVPFLTRRVLRGVSNRLRAAEGAPTYVWNRF